MSQNLVTIVIPKYVKQWRKWTHGNPYVNEAEGHCKRSIKKICLRSVHTKRYSACYCSVLCQWWRLQNGLNGCVTHYGLNNGPTYLRQNIGLNFFMCEQYFRHRWTYFQRLFVEGNYVQECWVHSEIEWHWARIGIKSWVWTRNGAVVWAGLTFNKQHDLSEHGPGDVGGDTAVGSPVLRLHRGDHQQVPDHLSAAREGLSHPLPPHGRRRATYST